MNAQAKNESMIKGKGSEAVSVPLTLFFSIIILILLAETYSGLGNVFESPWLSAAVVNSFLALVSIFYLFFRGNSNSSYPKISKFFENRPLIDFFDSKLTPYLIPLAVLLFIVLASSLSSMTGASEKIDIGLQQFAWVFWIPIVEEVVFRWGIGNFLRKKGGLLWGTYFSILVFSVSHSVPTISKLLDLQVGLPFGPLLLAVFCELLYVGSGKLGPAILLHAVCNGSIIIFSMIDSRWLEWLDFLYL